MIHQHKASITSIGKGHQRLLIQHRSCCGLSTYFFVLDLHTFPYDHGHDHGHDGTGPFNFMGLFHPSPSRKRCQIGPADLLGRSGGQLGGFVAPFRTRLLLQNSGTSSRSGRFFWWGGGFAEKR
eukprot:s1050_g12.t1